MPVRITYTMMGNQMCCWNAKILDNPRSSTATSTVSLDEVPLGSVVRFNTISDTKYKNGLVSYVSDNANCLIRAEHWLRLIVCNWLIRLLCICLITTDSSICMCIGCINWFIDMYMYWSHSLIRILCWCIDHIDRFVYYVYALVALTNSDCVYALIALADYRYVYALIVLTDSYIIDLCWLITCFA